MFFFEKHPFTQENGLLTSTGKKRRAKLTEKFREKFEMEFTRRENENKNTADFSVPPPLCSEPVSPKKSVDCIKVDALKVSTSESIDKFGQIPESASSIPSTLSPLSQSVSTVEASPSNQTEDDSIQSFPGATTSATPTTTTPSVTAAAATATTTPKTDRKTEADIPPPFTKLPQV